MHLIEAMLVVGALVAPVATIIAAIRWKRFFASRPAGIRYWWTLVSLCLSAAVIAGFVLMIVRAAYLDNAHYHELLVWERALMAVGLSAVIAAASARGAGRLWSLLGALSLLGFMLVFASIPP